METGRGIAVQAGAEPRDFCRTQPDRRHHTNCVGLGTLIPTKRDGSHGPAQFLDRQRRTLIHLPDHQHPPCMGH
jgi:hypothetical protein